MRNRRIAAIVLAVAMVCMTVAATSASARPQTASAPKAQTVHKAAAGGIFRVDWESSFDFTDGFDPDPKAQERRKAEAERSLAFFARTYFPHYCSAAPSVMHEWLFERLGRLTRATQERLELSARARRARHAR